jgi:hypothetical protein
MWWLWIFFFGSWQHPTKENQEDGGPCNIDISDNAITVIDQIWLIAQRIISESVNLMTPLLKLFGVDTEAMSSFCREFSSRN